MEKLFNFRNEMSNARVSTLPECSDEDECDKDRDIRFVRNKFIKVVKPNRLIRLQMSSGWDLEIFRNAVANWIWDMSLPPSYGLYLEEPIEVRLPFVAFLQIRENCMEIEPRYEVLLKVNRKHLRRFDADGPRLWRMIAGPSAIYKALDPKGSKNTYSCGQGDREWVLRYLIEPDCVHHPLRPERAAAKP